MHSVSQRDSMGAWKGGGGGGKGSLLMRAGGMGGGIQCIMVVTSGKHAWGGGAWGTMRGVGVGVGGEGGGNSGGGIQGEVAMHASRHVACCRASPNTRCSCREQAS
jgi:hypothetical protein